MWAPAYGEGAWAKKPAAVVSVSPGGIGGFGAHLRQSLDLLDMPVLQQPVAHVGGGASLFDGQGEFKSDDTRTFFNTIIDAFGQWVGGVR